MVTNLLVAAPHLATEAALSAASEAELLLFDPLAPSGERLRVVSDCQHASGVALFWGPAFEAAALRDTTAFQKQIRNDSGRYVCCACARAAHWQLGRRGPMAAALS